ncbi:hypothetical protein ACHAWX_006032 [Stephanocyclus meneghinianus]
MGLSKRSRDFFPSIATDFPLSCPSLRPYCIRRKEEFPKRLKEVLSALIFIAAESMPLRCSKELAEMDRRHARSQKKHVLTQEDEVEFNMSRLNMQSRVGQCRVCSREPDTANNDALIFPQARDGKEVRVHSSLTNIRDIRWLCLVPRDYCSLSWIYVLR